MAKMWMIHAGRGALLAQEFITRKYVAVGWIELGDLSDVRNREELERKYLLAFQGENENKIRMGLGQIARFRFEIQKGDQVITYDPEYRRYSVGTIQSDYIYQTNSPEQFNHIRNVEWSGTVTRDDLSVSTKPVFQG